MTPELTWTSVATDLMESWILPTAQTSTLLKQCGIILTENGTKGSQHPKKSFGMSFKKPGELFLKTTYNKACLRELAVSKYTVATTQYWLSLEFYKLIFFPIYYIPSYVCIRFNKSLPLCHAPWQCTKMWGLDQDLWKVPCVKVSQSCNSV